MPILTLPQPTIQAIGSSQVLTDPCSVVKELVDNALDARATSIFVEVSVNTLDVIQVKDDGHGISAEDRDLVCRRYCTSKLRQWSDLREVSARWLGFRGETLASAAEMSGGLTVTTRVQGEGVAVSLKIGKMGEVQSQTRASHPVGTTIRITDFFKSLPVRRQTAVKTSTQSLTKIKQVLQAYVLARPAIRFSLRVVKAKNEKDNWTYAPKQPAGVADAALKVAGRETAGECSFQIYGLDNIASENHDEDGEEGAEENPASRQKFRIEAFLPRADADASKVSGKGHFISVDSRPVSCARGVLKQILVLYKDYIRSALRTSSALRLINPFICMNIKCPTGSYDANIEPAKDDVLFEDSSHVLFIMESFFKSIYGKLETAKQGTEEARKSKTDAKKDSFELLLARKAPVVQEPKQAISSSGAASTQKSGREIDSHAVTTSNQSHVKELEQNAHDRALAPNPYTVNDSIDHEKPPKRRRTWRFNMYGGENEDMDDLMVNGDDDPAPLDDDDDPRILRDVTVNNPWIIAKMNAPLRSKNLDPDIPSEKVADPQDAQLPTPAREQSYSEGSSILFRKLTSPTERGTGDTLMTLPTPQRSQPSSPVKGLPSSPLKERADAYQQHQPETLFSLIPTSPVQSQDLHQSHSRLNKTASLTSKHPANSAPTTDFVSARNLPLGLSLDEVPSAPTRPSRKQKARKNPQHQNTLNKPFISPLQDPDQVWFSNSAPPRRPKPSSKPRAGTIRGAIDLSMPIRPTSDDEEEPSPDKASKTRTLTTNSKTMNLTDALDYEHRKQAATKRRRSQLLLSSSGTLERADEEGNVVLEPPTATITNSPHKNRYNAAKAALKRPTPQPFSNASTLPPIDTSTPDSVCLSCVFDDGDPRAYLVRVRRRSAKLGLNTNEREPNGAKIRRTKTVLLPLESTPVEARTKGLSLVLELGIEDVQEELRRVRGVEAYVDGGAAWGGFDGLHDGDGGQGVKFLEERLRRLVREGGWRMEGDEEVGVDLGDAIREHVRAMVAGGLVDDGAC